VKRRGSWWRLNRKGAGAGIKVSVAILYPLNLLLFRRKWHNIDRVPATGPAIVVINHISVIDPMVMAAFIWDTGRVPRFMIKSSLFKYPVIGWVFRTAKQIPVDRSGGGAKDSVAAARAALEGGEVLVIYPEGTTTKDPQGWPMKARTGMARLALDFPDVPVIPVGQWGTHKRGPGPRHRYIGRRPVTASVGLPVDLTEFTSVPLTLDALRQSTERIMVALRDEVAFVRDETPPTEFFKPPKAPPKAPTKS
jgi:1-acyl-sn-glycerol-3-phosphate acyltransferase